MDARMICWITIIGLNIWNTNTKHRVLSTIFNSIDKHRIVNNWQSDKNGNNMKQPKKATDINTTGSQSSPKAASMKGTVRGTKTRPGKSETHSNNAKDSLCDFSTRFFQIAFSGTGRVDQTQSFEDNQCL